MVASALGSRRSCVVPIPHAEALGSVVVVVVVSVIVCYTTSASVLLLLSAIGVSIA